MIPYGIGKRSLRDAQHETPAVLDHYFYQEPRQCRPIYIIAFDPNYAYFGSLKLVRHGHN